MCNIKKNRNSAKNKLQKKDSVSHYPQISAERSEMLTTAGVAVMAKLHHF